MNNKIKTILMAAIMSSVVLTQGGMCKRSTV